MSSCHIIIADDNLPMRVLIARMASRIVPHATISLVGDGQTAWELYQHEGADAVLTDYHMPILSGLGLIEKLRNASVDLPILMLSSDGSVELGALAAGATCFLHKTKLSHLATVFTTFGLFTSSDHISTADLLLATMDSSRGANQ